MDPGLSKRILIIDDDLEMQGFFAFLLNDEACSVIHAKNAAEASALHLEDPFDLAVVELLLPNKEGLKALMDLRRLPSPPKFIATAKSSWMPAEVYTKMAKQLGVHATLAKPFELGELITVVRGVLGL
jgi:DNA-binding response OmpR family regulator